MPSNIRDRTYSLYRGYKTCSESRAAGYIHIAYDQDGYVLIQTHSSAILKSFIDRLIALRAG